MRHLRVVVEYDGTDFSGWQRQGPEGGPTVQGAIEDALAQVCDHPVTLRGAGRTDAGVHATGQVASFHTTSHVPELGILRGVNAALPRSIVIASIDLVPEAFDARRWSAGKHYRYRIWNREARSPLIDRQAWHVHRPLDDLAMHEAGQRLLGTHDFTAFRAADCDRKNPVRTITRLDVVRHGDLIQLDVEGTAFLKHMVRIIVGTLEECGRGRRTADQVGALLASRDRTPGGRTAPAKGLTLVTVRYLTGPDGQPRDHRQPAESTQVSPKE
jgi:tRNA pseudouridine38-40 synthase